MLIMLQQGYERLSLLKSEYASQVPLQAIPQGDILRIAQGPTTVYQTHSECSVVSVFFSL